MRQGIISNDGCTENCFKFRIDAKDKSAASNARDNAIANAYEDNFIIPLNFEMLDNTISYYQSGLPNILCYQLTFNNYDQVILSTGLKRDSDYKISDISLEYKIVTQPDLPRHVAMEYQSMALLYDRVLWHRQTPVNKSDTTWNWSFNMPCKSLKCILVLFETEQSFALGTTSFTIPRYKKSQ